MLKGVNKKVVEVVDIDHEYFEKAILFIKHEHIVKDEKTLKDRANVYINNINYAPRRLSPLRFLTSPWLKLSLALVILLSAILYLI